MVKRDRAGNELPVADADVDQFQAIDNGIVTPIELTNTTGTCLDQLNDHCLLEIFSKPSLTPIDFLSLSRTCKRFKQIIQCVFPKKFSIRCDYIGYKFKSKKNPLFPMKHSDIDRALETFGSRLSTLLIYRWDRQLVDLIAKYYDDISLKRLVIHADCSYHETVVYCWDLVWPIDNLVQLEIFVKVEVWLKLGISRCTLPNLEQFIVYAPGQTRNTRDTVESEIFLKFIERHRGLKVLSLHMGGMYGSSKFVETIINSCNKLEQLTLRGLHILRDKDGVDSVNLQSSHTLKMLNFGPTHKTLLIELLQTLNPIEFVKIPDVRFAPAGTYDALSQIQTLRKLCLCRGNFVDIPWTQLIQLTKLYLRESMIEFEGIHMVNIIRELPNLEEFEFDEGERRFTFTLFELQPKEFHEIVTVVEQQQRLNVLTLICKYNVECLEHCHGKVKLAKPFKKK